MEPHCVTLKWFKIDLESCMKYCILEGLMITVPPNEEHMVCSTTSSMFERNVLKCGVIVAVEEL